MVAPALRFKDSAARPLRAGWAAEKAAVALGAADERVHALLHVRAHGCAFVCSCVGADMYAGARMQVSTRARAHAGACVRGKAF